ncbi:hypothetical protein GBF38_008701 [Nibea albiflora]|uniref:Uncharacterized protein n=1 Tax=Nibea albiflora TaxID=240163 RepID=A0ACB7ES43_NIBAL|nr:hypothetical protein GBF38_008701 [Nibea albiflora]
MVLDDSVTDRGGPAEEVEEEVEASLREEAVIRVKSRLTLVSTISKSTHCNVSPQTGSPEQTVSVRPRMRLQIPPIREQKVGDFGQALFAPVTFSCSAEPVSFNCFLLWLFVPSILFHPPPPPPAACVRLWLQPERHWRGRVNRPVRSPRISVGLECAVALALDGDTTLGAGGGGGVVVVVGG